MPRYYEQSIEIDAPPKQVWPVMANVTHWSQWTPTILRVVVLTTGPMGVGARVRIRQPRLPPAIWRVTEWQPDHHFTWVSVAPGVRVTARHAVDSMNTGCRVCLSLNYDGIWGGLVARLTHRFNIGYLELEANGLKVHCEALAAGRTLPPISGLTGPK